MARTHYIAGNWKMNTTKAEAVALAKDLVEQLKGKTNKYMIGVPFVYLDAVAQVVKGSNILLAAQDCAATDNGRAFQNSPSAVTRFCNSVSYLTPSGS